MTTPPEPSPEEYAVSPALGPVPAISVHLSLKHAITQRQHLPIGGIMSDIPADLRYSTDHLWVRPGADGLVRVGVTDFAQQSLGDVVDVSPPKPGDAVTAGEACGDIESVKRFRLPAGPLSGMRMVVRTWPADVGTPWLCETVQEIDAGVPPFGCPPVAS